MPPLPPIEYDPPVHPLFGAPLIARSSPRAIAAYEPRARWFVRSWTTSSRTGPRISGGQDVAPILECLKYFGELYELRSQEPTDDIPSILLDVRVDGEPITGGQFVLNMVMFDVGRSGHHDEQWFPHVALFCRTPRTTANSAG